MFLPRFYFTYKLSKVGKQAYCSNITSDAWWKELKKLWYHSILDRHIFWKFVNFFKGLAFYFLPLHQKLFLHKKNHSDTFYLVSFTFQNFLFNLVKNNFHFFFILTFVHIGMPRINMKKHIPTVKSFLCFNKVLG